MPPTPPPQRVTTLENGHAAVKTEQPFDDQAHAPIRASDDRLTGDGRAVQGGNCDARAFSICRTLKAKPHSQLSARARQTIYRANDPLNGVKLICDGWAFTFMLLPDGRRQILSFLLPGDIISARAVLQERLPLSVHTLTAVQHCSFDRAELIAAIKSDPKVFAQFAELCAAEIDQAHELATDMGRRTTDQRIARLILTLRARLAARNLVHEQGFEFPLRQQHIADATGVTSVHVSRVMTALQDAGVIDIRARRLRILKPGELERIANAH